MANTYLQRTNTSATNTYTFSAWVKLANPSNNDNQWIFTSNDSGLMIRGTSAGSSGEQFHFYNNSNATNYFSGAKRRDVSAWYHIVLSSSSGTGTLYVNGETDKTGIVVPNLSTSTNAMQIGRLASAGSQYFDGAMSHIHFIDGTAYDASAFGKTDTTTGEWEAKTSPSVTYGTNGFFILKDGNGITDQSGEGNDFTLGGGTLTDLKDNPDNVFATLNPLATSSYNTLTNGNLTVAGNADANDGKTYSTLVMPNATSKFYWEIKCVSKEDNGNPKYGFIQASRGFDNSNGNAAAGTLNPCYDFIIRPSGQIDTNGSTGSVITSTWGAGDILSFALDSINGACYVGINGVWQTSGNPTSGASRTGAILTWSPTQGGSIGALDGQAIYISSYATGSVSNVNFGNGFFGTTAITTNSGNGYAGAEGSSKFNYTVPTGYSALNTKGLNE